MVQRSSIKYILAGICILAAIGECLPIYLLAEGLAADGPANNMGYFVTRLLLHIVICISLIVAATGFYKNAHKRQE